MEDITLEKIWCKLEEIDGKVEELGEFIAKKNLDVREELSKTNEDLAIVKHNVLLVRQYEAEEKHQHETAQ